MAGSRLGWEGAVEINGDHPLSMADRFRYLAHGLREIAQSVGRWRPVKYLRVDVRSPETSAKVAEGASPFRVYTCAVAERVAADYVRYDGPICDLGCGAGSHARFFSRCARRNMYLGVDVAVESHWSASAAGAGGLRRRFVQMSALELGVVPESLAFTFSSSLLEHVARVEVAIREMAWAMRPGAYGLHSVPSEWSLFLYLFHGYRRFSAGSLRQLFEGSGIEVVQLWALGGLPSFLLHLVWITCPLLVGKFVPSVPERMRAGRAVRVYSVMLGTALWLDRWFPFLPVGYAILIRRPEQSDAERPGLADRMAGKSQVAVERSVA